MSLQQVLRVRALVFLALLFTYPLILTSCRKDREVLEEGSAGAEFSDGTVGQAMSEYRLSMDKVRDWYAASISISEGAGDSLDINIEMYLSEELARYVAQLDSIDFIQEVLAEDDLSSEEFLILTGLVSAGWDAVSRHADNDTALINVDPRLAQFFAENLEELEALQGRLLRAR